MFLAALLALGAGDLSAQQTAVCSSTPGEGERIECTQPATSSNEISLTPLGIDIDTMDNNAPGIFGHHEGTGRILIDLQTGQDGEGGLIRNDIDTMGDDAPGIYGRHEGSGNIEIGAQNANITTAGEDSHGFHAFIGYRPGNPPTPDPPPVAAGVHPHCRFGVNHRDGRKWLQRRLRRRLWRCRPDRPACEQLHHHDSRP